MRIRIPVLLVVLAGFGILASAQGPGKSNTRPDDADALVRYIKKVRELEPQDRTKSLFQVLDKKVATAKRWVELAERVQARVESYQRSGRVSPADVAAAGGKVYDARIALATTRQQLYAAKAEYAGDQKAKTKVVEAIEQKIAAARPRVSMLKERLKSVEMLIDAGRAQTSEVENVRIELLRVELDVLEFSRELAEFRLTSEKK